MKIFRSSEDSTFVAGFDSSMLKQNDKWIQKVNTDIKNIYMQADLLQQTVRLQLNDAQSRVEAINHDLVNRLKFHMKALPNLDKLPIKDQNM